VLNCGTAQTCSGNQCICPQKSSTNLLANPGFDGSIGSWSNPSTPYGSDTYSSDDADGCLGSGSVSITGATSASQCVIIGSSVGFYFGVHYKGILTCQVLAYWSDNSCGSSGGSSLAGNNALMTDYNGVSVWTPRSLATTTPAGTASMQVSCSGVAGDSKIDKVYINTSGDYF
jgi:hypothetical protein